jgi:hypothetical protein
MGEKRFGKNIPFLSEGFDNLPVADGLAVKMILAVDHDMDGENMQAELFFQTLGEIGRTVADQSDALWHALVVLLEYGPLPASQFQDNNVLSMRWMEVSLEEAGCQQITLTLA